MPARQTPARPFVTLSRSRIAVCRRLFHTRQGWLPLTRGITIKVILGWPLGLVSHCPVPTHIRAVLLVYSPPPAGHFGATAASRLPALRLEPFHTSLAREKKNCGFFFRWRRPMEIMGRAPVLESPSGWRWAGMDGTRGDALVRTIPTLVTLSCLGLGSSMGPS